jgi:hypothetical protein
MLAKLDYVIEPDCPKAATPRLFCENEGVWGKLSRQLENLPAGHGVLMDNKITVVHSNPITLGPHRLVPASRMLFQINLFHKLLDFFNQTLNLFRKRLVFFATLVGFILIFHGLMMFVVNMLVPGAPQPLPTATTMARYIPIGCHL